MMNVTPQPHWLARSIGSAALTPALLVCLVGITLWSLSRSSPWSALRRRP